MACLAGGFVASLLLVNGYFIWKTGVARFLWCVLIYPLKYYPKQANWNTFMVVEQFAPPFGAHLHVPQLLFYCAVQWFDLFATPVVFAAFFIWYWVRREKEPWDYWARPMLVACIGLMMFLSIANSPSPLRMAVSSLPALILLGFFIDSQRIAPRILPALCAAGVLVLAGYSMIRMRPVIAGTITTSQGRFAMLTDEESLYREYDWINRHTRPGDYFYEPGYADMYFFLDLRNPTALGRIVNNGYTTQEQVADVIRSLEKHRVRYIYWGPGDFLNAIPNWENPADAHLGPLREYLHRNYAIAMAFPRGSERDEIWERKTESSR
jgi:hypothetical protein